MIDFDNIINLGIWKHFRIKACLLRGENDEEWKVGLLYVYLLEKKEASKKPQFKPSKHIKLIDQILAFDELDQFLHVLQDSRSITIDGEQVLLEHLSQKDIEFFLSSFSKEYFGIDQPSFVFSLTDNFSKIRTIARNAESDLKYNDPPFESLRDLCESQLELEFGTDAFPTSFRIIAPLFCKIEDSDIREKSLSIRLRCPPKLKPNIMLNVFGDSAKKPNQIREMIGEFPKSVSNLIKLRPIPLKKDTNFLRISLHYHKNNIEVLVDEEFIKLASLEEVTEASEITRSPSSYLDSMTKLIKIKDGLREQLTKAIYESNSYNKGKLLEDMITELFTSLAKLKFIESRSSNGYHEIDIVFRNYNNSNVWKDLGGIIIVECKNWKDPAGSREIRDFEGKMENMKIKTGIFVATNGVTGTTSSRQGAMDQVKDCFNKRENMILVLGSQDLDEILNCADMSDKLDKKYMEFYR